MDLKNKEFYPELRDFLRYLFAQGYIEKDFSTLVPKFNRGIRIPETYDISEIIDIENEAKSSGRDPQSLNIGGYTATA